MWQFLLGAFLGGAIFGLIGFLIGYWVVQQGGAQEAGQVVAEHVDEHRDDYGDKARALGQFLFGGRRKFVWLILIVVILMVCIGLAGRTEPVRVINPGLNPFSDGCGKTVNVDVTLQDVSRGFVYVGTGECERRQELGPNNPVGK